MADDETNGARLPYASWTTCLHMIERMEKEGVPNRIDNSYLVGMAGGTQAQVKHALRSLDLMDEQGSTTPRLVALAKQADQRQDLLGNLLRERFPRLAELGVSATRGELDEMIKSYGLNGATARKAATFYLGAAAYAGLPLSPHIRPARPGGTGNGSTARRHPARRSRQAQPSRKPGLDSNGDTYTVDLSSGGTVSVVVSVNLFTMTTEDRNFIIDLVDKLKGYRQVGGQGKEDPS